MSVYFHTQCIGHELSKRKLKNNRYSLRAFAVFLGLHPSALSRILQGKQDVSVPSAIVIIGKLELSGEEKHSFIESVARQKYQNAFDALVAGTSK